MGSQTEKVACLGREALSAVEWTIVARRLRLSRREAEISKLVFEDRCDASIAMELEISPHTVNSHFKRLYRKLGVHSRVQLVIAVYSACRSSARRT